MPPNAFSDFYAYLGQLMIGHASIFEALGNTMFMAFAGISLTWFWIEVALKGEGIPMDRFANWMMTFAIGLAMTRFYSVPIPGLGISFYHIIVDQGTYLANYINAEMVSRLSSRIFDLYMSMESPSWWDMATNAKDVIRYAIIVLVLAFALIAVFFVIALGYIAVAIGVLIGPCMIPFFILPKMEWVFWGWVRALIQYSFYPVFANAYLFVMGNLFINFTDHAGTDLSGGRMVVMFVPLVSLLMALALGTLKIPSICNSYYTGRSGESAASW